MVKQVIVQNEEGICVERELGVHRGTKHGPLVIGIGGIHGNEPAGVVALQNVLRQLRQSQLPFQGKLVALAGNLRALRAGSRYLHHDLNRLWLPERVQLLKAQSRNFASTGEEQEQYELLVAIENTLIGHVGPAIFLDLHTTSSDGAPFALISDTLTNRRLALQLGVPLILGLEENVEGTILNYINDLGYEAIGFEAGQHQAPQSVKNHEAAIWLTLVASGCLTAHDIPAAQYQEQLRAAAQGLPSVLEVRYRHAIQDTDQFVMRPGFSNFSSVERGQPLALDQQGAICAQERSLLFMPLYQKQGEDGFFLVREVKPFWLSVSAWLRHWQTDRILHWLPGVRRLFGNRNALVIDRHVARWLVLPICHLLGFRKHTQTDGILIISRRRQSSFH